jgi:OmcA/MtrC family decaheme c-type cytochrome
MRKGTLLLVALSLLLPLVFFGCSGSDGAAGAPGATGATGPTGPTGPAGAPGEGVVASETCTLCHGAGKTYDVATMHSTNAGTATAAITGAAFSPDNASVVMTFTFSATDSAGNTIADNILLTPSGSNLAFARFTIARLIPGTAYPASGTTEPDTWFYYGDRSHRAKTQLTFDGSAYTFTFVSNTVLDPAWAGYTHRVGIEIYGFGGPSVNPTFDFVPNGGALARREIVTTAACNGCHDTLGVTPSPPFHGGRRVDTKFCVLCHNTNNGLAPQSAAAGAPSVPIPFAKAIHGVHTSQDLLVFEGTVNNGDFTELEYPQDVRNCTTCHKGPDGDNWKNRPNMVGCGSCHTDVNFTTGANHLGGAAANNQFCALCHTPALIVDYHATENVTPNNPQLRAGLAAFEYNISSVTVNASNQAVVNFWIKKNGTAVNLKDNTALTGFTFGPGFLVAYANNVTNPQDYSNFGKSAGQPASVNLSSLLSTLTSTDNVTFTATLTAAPFPAGAKMRAVALQSYFTQTNVDVDGDGVNDNVARHTPSVQKNVTGDAVRRTVVKSGYNLTTGQPEGCLECHETFEGHGGSRVNNVQVCVMCHNPSNTSSGRIINPAGSSPINPDIVALYGSDPLAYPEVSANFKNLIHGIHSASMRVDPFIFIRNRTSGGFAGVLLNGDEITFPGNLKNCNKCHIGDSFKADLPTGVDFSTAKITTGVSTETRTEITTARGTVPNSTDLVISPIVSACGMCHNSDTDRSHFALMGGDIQATRSYAEKVPETLSVTLPAP